MATPPDVVANEVIEVEWGNAVRDFACFGVDFNLAADNTSAAATGSFVSGASVTFTKPSDWVAYTIMAWGTVMGRAAAGTSTLQCVVDIGGTDGTAVISPAVVSGSALTCAANCRRTGQTGNSLVAIQFRQVAGSVQKESSVVQYLAYRTS